MTKLDQPLKIEIGDIGVDETKFVGADPTQNNGIIEGIDTSIPDEAIIDEILADIAAGNEINIADKYPDLPNPATIVTEVLNRVKEDASLQDYVENHMLKFSTIAAINEVVNSIADNSDVLKALQPVVNELVHIVLDWSPSEAQMDNIKHALSEATDSYLEDSITLGQYASTVIGVVGNIMSNMAYEKRTDLLNVVQDAYHAIEGTRPEWISSAKDALTDAAINAMISSFTGYDFKDGVLKIGKSVESDPATEFLLFLVANAMGPDNYHYLLGSLVAIAPVIDSALTYGSNILLSVSHTLANYTSLAIDAASGKLDNAYITYITDSNGVPGLLFDMGGISLYMALDPTKTISPIRFNVTAGVPGSTAVAKKAATSWLKKAFNAMTSVVTIGFDLAKAAINQYTWDKASDEYKAKIQEVESNLMRYINTTVPEQFIQAATQLCKSTLYDIVDYILFSVSRDSTITLNGDDSLVLPNQNHVESVDTTHASAIIDSGSTQSAASENIVAHSTLPTGDLSVNANDMLKRRASNGVKDTKLDRFLVPGVIDDDVYQDMGSRF